VAQPKHARQWLATLERHAFPLIGNKPVADIGTDEVLHVLRPIWSRIPETASRLRQRIEAVLDDAAVRGWRPAGVANPARWRGHLAATLPQPKRVKPVRHHPALPWQDVPAFMAALAERDGITARALAFAILTASRSGAVRLMRWREVDMEARVWTVPAAHMKARRAHRVPLSDAALAILTAMQPHARGPESLVFPGGRAGRPLSDMALSMLVAAWLAMGCPMASRRAGVMPRAGPSWCTGSGRAFKGWSLAAGWPDTLSELALAHADRDKVRAAYARDDLAEQRRPMMEAWAEHCAGQRGMVASLAAARVRRMTP
jgi:integrase